MKTAKRYFMDDSKMPDLILIPNETESTRKNSNYLEKMLFYREMFSMEKKVLVCSKRLLEKIGGFEESLGFGEDKLFQKKAFELLKVDKDTQKKYSI